MTTAADAARAMSRMEMKLFPIPQSAGIARTFVAHHLASLGFSELVDDACLIASELVTNALAETPRQPIWIQLSHNRSGGLLLEVWDASPSPPVRQNTDPLAEAGRGLVIAEALAPECGYRVLDGCGGGKIVWARLR